MSKVKLNISRLSIPEKIARCRQIVQAMTGNGNFPHANPPLETVSGALTTLETDNNAAQAARQEAKAKTTTQNNSDDVLDRLMGQLAAYVETTAAGDEAMIRSAGMDTKVRGSMPSNVSQPPANLNATTGDHDGEIDLSWEAVPGAKSYIIEQSLDADSRDAWSHAAASTRSGQTIQGLTSGTRYWFRVAALNMMGQSGWSDPATKIAP